MVDTYGESEQRFYYVDESAFGTTPNNPAMLSVACDSLDPGFDPGNMLVRGSGSYDLQAIKKGVRKPAIKLSYVVPSSAPINLLQYVKQDLNKSLSCQVIYYKGAFASATDLLSLLYKGMRISKASVSCNLDDVVRAELNLLGQDIETEADKISGATYTDYGGAVAFNETYAKKDTITLDRVVAWKFDVDNGVRQVPVIRSSNGHLAKYVTWGKRVLSGEVLFEFESKTEMDEALADTEFDLEFGVGGSNKAVFPDCKWSDITNTKWLEDLISVRARFDSKGPLTIS